MSDMGQVMKGRIRKENWSGRQELQGNSGRINITASSRQLPQGATTGCVVTSHATGFRGIQSYSSGGECYNQKGLSMSVKWVDATIADRDEVMKQDDMGHCGNRQLYG